MGAMEDAEFFLKKLWKRFMKKFQVGNGLLQLVTKTRDHLALQSRCIEW